MIYDLIIVGMGPAGVTASIYAKRAGLNILCLDKGMIGGYLNFIDRIDNYPGCYNVTGPELAFNLYTQIKNLEINYKNEEVIDVVDEAEEKVVKTSKNEYKCKYLIIATGRISKKLGLENEDVLLGKGLSHCALCDGYLYKNQDVVVVGGGESALTEALYLANICHNVYLIHRGENFKAAKELIERILKKQNIILKKNRKIKTLNIKDNKLDSLSLDNGEKLNVSCLFSYIGYVPGTNFAITLGLADKNGYIKVDEKYETEHSGIYAIGDIIEKEMYQIVTANAEGAIAANEVIKRIKAK